MIPLRAAGELWSRISPLSSARFDPGQAAGLLRAYGTLTLGRTLISHRRISNRWHVDPADLRRAAADLAETAGGAPVPVGQRAGWRAKLSEGLDRWTEAGWFDHASWGFLYLPEPAEPLGRGWTLPAGYAVIVADGYRICEQARRAALGCARCGRPTRGQLGPQARTVDGWENLCARCERVFHGALRDYAGELHAVRYPPPRAGTRRAIEYRCAGCGQQAAYWDHCHEHGFVRGPLCGPCNTWDGARMLSIRPPLDHLWQCPRCRTGRLISVHARAKTIRYLMQSALPAGREPCPPHTVAAGPDQVALIDALTRRTGLTLRGLCLVCQTPQNVRLGRAELAALDARAVQRLTASGP
jgi:hypothetical protein